MRPGSFSGQLAIWRKFGEDEGDTKSQLSAVDVGFKRSIGMDSAVVSKPSQQEAWKRLGITAVSIVEALSAFLKLTPYSTLSFARLRS